MRPPLDAFLALLQDSPDVPRHRGVMREQLGDEILEMLEREEMLIEGDASDWYPCPSAGDGCPRVVHRNLGREHERPHLARCGSPGSECSSLRLTSDDLRTASLAMDRVRAFLQLLMGLPPEPVTVDSAFEYVHRLGKEPGSGRLVLLYERFGTSSLAAELVALRQRHGAAHIYMPTPTWVRPEVARAHGPGADPQLSFLSERLRFAREGLAWSPAPGMPALVGAAAPHAAVPADAFCLAFDGQVRPLGEDAYRAAVESAAEQELFLDLVHRHGTQYRGGAKQHSGEFREVKLSHAEGVFAGRFILSREPRRLASLRPKSTGHFRFFQRVRGKLDVLDVPTVRRVWRFFQSVGDTRAEETYAFRPGNRKFLLLYPKELKP